MGEGRVTADSTAQARMFLQARDILLCGYAHAFVFALRIHVRGTPGPRTTAAVRVFSSEAQG